MQDFNLCPLNIGTLTDHRVMGKIYRVKYRTSSATSAHHDAPGRHRFREKSPGNKQDLPFMPLGSNLATPRGSIVSIDLLWEKNSKIFFSETTGHTALIFCMWQLLMVLYINCASHAPGVKFGHAPGVDSLHRLTMGKT